MPYVKYLVPLTGYESSTVADINDDGLCVGTSYDVNPLGWLAASRATLWSGDTPIALRKKPAQGFQAGVSPSSHAMRIDKSGRVLCKADTNPPSYYLWLSETEPAVDLSASVEGLVDAIDLNDNGLLLYTLTGGGLAVQDMTTNARTFLPQYPNPGSDFHPVVPTGLDNAGRVVANAWAKSGAELGPESRVYYWKPTDPNQWHQLASPSHLWFPPVLAKKDGYVIVTAQGQPHDGRAYYYDLDASIPTGVQIPAGENVPGHLSAYLDVTSDGWFVGGEGPGGVYTPTRYKKSDNSVQLLEYAYPTPDWDPSYAVAANNLRIVGDSRTPVGGHGRAWKLVLNSPSTGHESLGPGHWHFPPAIDPKAALLGVTSRWYVLLTLPDPAPLDVLREVVRDLKPEERREVLPQVQRIGTRFEALAKMLREAGVD